MFQNGAYFRSGFGHFLVFNKPTFNPSSKPQILSVIAYDVFNVLCVFASNGKKVAHKPARCITGQFWRCLYDISKQRGSILLKLSQFGVGHWLALIHHHFCQCFFPLTNLIKWLYNYIGEKQ